MTPPPIRVMCVDDHPLVCQGIESMIQSQPDLELVARAATGEHALELFRQHRPDVILMDLRLPGMGGIETTRAIRAENAAARIVILTMCGGDQNIAEALEAGAEGYLLKDISSDELASAVRRVHAGQRTVSREAADLMALSFHRTDLTHRERDVVGHLADGKRNSEIATALGIGEETVKMHLHNLFEKLAVRTRSEAVSVAVRRGIIHLP